MTDKLTAFIIVQRLANTHDVLLARGTCGCFALYDPVDFVTRIYPQPFAIFPNLSRVFDYLKNEFNPWDL